MSEAFSVAIKESWLDPTARDAMSMWILHQSLEGQFWTTKSEHLIQVVHQSTLDDSIACLRPCSR